ncbi:hypothetical protein Bca101_034283 [Brassica carinata]
MSRLFISHIWSSAIFFSLVSSSHLLLRNPSVSPTTVDKLHHHAPFGTITSSQKHINASAHISIVTLSPLRRHRNKKQNVVTCLHLHLVSVRILDKQKMKNIRTRREERRGEVGALWRWR